MSKELLPCPFCGGTNLEIAHAADKNGTYDWKVACADCYIFHETEEQAIASWNRRADYDGDYTAVDLDETQGFTLQEKPEDE